MKTLTGTYGKDCKVFTDNIEPKALETIQKLLDNPVTEGKPVRIMPDTHDGKGIVIGFTMPVEEWVNPNHIGVDIGCGMLCAEIKSTITPDMYIDIDQRIREVVPMGFEVHEDGSNKNFIFGPFYTLGDLYYRRNIDELVQKIGMTRELWENSLGTLGGGNHFIELGRSENTGKYYLTIHSGSRNFGKRVCDYHAKNLDGYKKMLDEEVERIKQTLPKQQWNDAIKEAKKRLQGREGYLTGEAKEDYLKDMYIAQAYASVNRYTMLHLILRRMDWQSGKVIETVHNYISPKDGIIRKGAVSAHLGEELIIPMNMADGILLCRGKGNEDWNCSAPHGAGRLFSRTAAKEQLSMEEFRQRMNKVYSTSVCESTLDESPMAYKPTGEIRSLIEPTVEVLDVIKPVINLKAK
jgi:RNA-splicing ligase RtcB